MKIYYYIFLFMIAVWLSSCSSRFWGGAATGVVGAGAGYEYNAHRQMEQLEEDYEAGRIDKEEYEARKDQIEESSIIK